MADINCCFILQHLTLFNRGFEVGDSPVQSDKYSGDAQGVVYYEYGEDGVHAL